MQGLTCITGPCTYLSYIKENKYYKIEGTTQTGPFYAKQTYCTYDYTCPVYVPSLINGTCMWTCAENYFWEDGHCQRWCDSQWYKVIDGKRVC